MGIQCSWCYYLRLSQAIPFTPPGWVPRDPQLTQIWCCHSVMNAVYYLQGGQDIKFIMTSYDLFGIFISVKDTLDISSDPIKGQWGSRILYRVTWQLCTWNHLQLKSLFKSLVRVMEIIKDLLYRPFVREIHRWLVYSFNAASVSKSWYHHDLLICMSRTHRGGAPTFC